MLTEDIRNWVDAQKLGLPVRITGDVPSSDKDGIELTLAGIDQSTSYNDLAVRPLRLTLTYRLTFRAADPAQAHKALCEFMFSTMATPFLLAKSPNAKPVPLTLVTGEAAQRRYGAPVTAASIYLDVVVERPRIEKQTELVREPAVVRSRTMN